MAGAVLVWLYEVSWEVPGFEQRYEKVLIEALGKNSQEAMQDLFYRMAHRSHVDRTQIHLLHLKFIGDDEEKALDPTWDLFAQERQKKK